MRLDEFYLGIQEGDVIDFPGKLGGGSDPRYLDLRKGVLQAVSEARRTLNAVELRSARMEAGSGTWGDIRGDLEDVIEELRRACQAISDFDTTEE